MRICIIEMLERTQMHVATQIKREPEQKHRLDDGEHTHTHITYLPSEDIPSAVIYSYGYVCQACLSFGDNVCSCVKYVCACAGGRSFVCVHVCLPLSGKVWCAAAGSGVCLTDTHWSAIQLTQQRVCVLHTNTHTSAVDCSALSDAWSLTEDNLELHSIQGDSILMTKTSGCLFNQ